MFIETNSINNCDQVITENTLIKDRKKLVEEFNEHLISDISIRENIQNIYEIIDMTMEEKVYKTIYFLNTAKILASHVVAWDVNIFETIQDIYNDSMITTEEKMLKTSGLLNNGNVKNLQMEQEKYLLEIKDLKEKNFFLLNENIQLKSDMQNKKRKY